MRIAEITTAQAVTIAGGPAMCTRGEAAIAMADMLGDPAVAKGHRLADAAEHLEQAVRDACPWWQVAIPEEAAAWSDQESELQAAEKVLELSLAHGVRHAVQVPDGWEPCEHGAATDDPFAGLLALLAAAGAEELQGNDDSEDQRP